MSGQGKPIGGHVGFSIAEIGLARGVVGICPLPGRDGAGAADMEVVAAWRPDLVLTLVQSVELRRKAMADLPALVFGTGAAWLHFAIPDFGTPNREARAEWPGLLADLCGRLSIGERILVHCMGGCGRSGMIVLRLMVHMGEQPDAALIRLRAERPCAVETKAQLAWAIQA
ncbi:MAG: hypothetical protein RIR95_1310 [Pseudomonadota bacterium]